MSAALLAGVLTAMSLQAPPLTIDQAVLIAEQNAFAVRLQQTTVERDRQAIALALAALGPTLGINVVYTQNGTESTAVFTPGSPPIVLSPFSTTTAAAQISLPIDIAGNANRLVGSSRAAFEAARQSLEASFNDARLNARSAYLAVLRSQALVTVAQEELADANGRLKQAQEQFAQQQIAKIDVDSFDAQVAQSTSDLLNAQNNLSQANNALNLALARPIETPVQLAEVAETPPIPPDTSLLATRAQQARPEARSLVDQIRSLALLRRAQEAGMDPSLNLGLGYNRNLNTTTFSGPSASTALTFTLGVPIFDSGATRARVREARQDETTAKIELQQEQLSISQEVRNAMASLASAQARVVNANRQVTLATEVFRLAKVRQDAGEGTYVEVIDAENSLVQAKDGLVSAKYDYLLAYSQLQHGVGNDQVDQPAPGAPSLPGGKK